MTKAALFIGLVTSAFASFAADVTVGPSGEICDLGEAVRKVRALRASGAIPPGRAAEVAVRPGRYRVRERLVLTAADSGIHFTGAGHERSVLDAGVVLPPFTVRTDGVWTTPVPKGLSFDQLWVGGRRAVRARTPNAFYHYMVDPVDDDANRSFVAEPDDAVELAKLPADELGRVQVVFWQSWDMGYGAVKSVDAKTGVVALKSGAARSLFFWHKTRPRYAFENLRSALDAPGEWFHDAKANVLLYVPRAGETPETVRATVPQETGIVFLAGDRVKGEVVRDIAFSGLGFEHAGWQDRSAGVVNEQAASNVPEAAIGAQDAEDVVIENCRVAHVAAHGVWLRRGCVRCRVRHCLVEDTGAGGVYLGNTSWRNQTVAEQLELSDSIVRHGGRFLNGAIGVWLGHARDSRIVHNEICDFFYTGVSLGWTWGYAETVNRRNRIAWNRIHHVGQRRLSDMAAVYSLGDSAGTEVVGNHIWESHGYVTGNLSSFGLYTDEGAHAIYFASNLIERCDSALHQHYGKENRFVNNICVNFDWDGANRCRDEAHVTYAFDRNIFYWQDPKANAVTGWGKPGAAKNLPADCNVYWCAGGAVGDTAFKGVSWETWQKGGADAHGVIADPLFVDPAKGDWRLKPDSPALARGFVPFDWREAGVLKDDSAWAKLAEEETWGEQVVPPEPPIYLREKMQDGFESLAPGAFVGQQTWKTSWTVDAGRADALVVTADDVANGCRALRFQDSPALRYPFQPHLYTTPCVTGGTVVVSFAFKPVKGGGMTFQLRDYADRERFAFGPSVEYDGRAVRVGGTVVSEVAPGTWATVEVRASLNGASAGKWSVAVTPRGGERKERMFSLAADTKFRRLNWIGFMTYGSADSVWMLDDFTLNKGN